MATKTKSTPEPSLTELTQGILDDVRNLLGQQVDLLKAEVRGELDRAAVAAAAGGAGVGLVALGGIFSAHMLVHWLNRSTRLPLWGCYGLVGGALGVAGAGLLNEARRRAAGVHLAPQTTAAIRENLAWLHEQTTSGRPA